MICHLCLVGIEVDDGVVAGHKDTDGQLCPASGEAVWTWDEAATRAAVAGRSGGICEVCCARRATDMHHRVPRSLRGRWTPANILHICRQCHTWLTDDPKGQRAARERGLSLNRTEDPEKIPVKRLTGELNFLSNDLVGRKISGKSRLGRTRR